MAVQGTSECQFGFDCIHFVCFFIMCSPSHLFFSTAFHEVSVYPKKELPFFILFTAGLCSFTAMLALLTHQFPELMGVFAKAVSILCYCSLLAGRAKLNILTRRIHFHDVSAAALGLNRIDTQDSVWLLSSAYWSR